MKSLEERIKTYDEKGLIWPDWRIEKNGNRVARLGKGGFGSVYKVYKVGSPGLTRAMKVIGAENLLNDRSIKRVRQEIQLQITLGGLCGYIVAIDDIASIPISPDDPDSPEDFFIRMEILEPLVKKEEKNGELRARTVLCRKPLKDGDIGEIFKLAEHIGKALLAAHTYQEDGKDRPIIHRDVKLDNIMYEPKGDRYKLGDFGVSTVMENMDMSHTPYTGTRAYMAPEVYHHHYDQRADIYSYGIVLYLLLNDMKDPCCGLPIWKMLPDDVFERYEASSIPEPAHGTPLLKKLAAKACDNDPQKRYHDMKELLADLEKAKKEYLEEEYFRKEKGRKDQMKNPSAADKKKNQRARSEKSLEELLAGSAAEVKKKNGMTEGTDPSHKTPGWNMEITGIGPAEETPKQRQRIPAPSSEKMPKPTKVSAPSSEKTPKPTRVPAPSSEQMPESMPTPASAPIPAPAFASALKPTLSSASRQGSGENREEQKPRPKQVIIWKEAAAFLFLFGLFACLETIFWKEAFQMHPSAALAGIIAIILGETIDADPSMTKTTYSEGLRVPFWFIAIVAAVIWAMKDGGSMVPPIVLTVIIVLRLPLLMIGAGAAVLAAFALTLFRETENFSAFSGLPLPVLAVLCFLAFLTFWNSRKKKAQKTS